MFDFVNKLFIDGEIDEHDVMAYAPTFITKEQAEEIISGVYPAE